MLAAANKDIFFNEKEMTSFCQQSDGSLMLEEEV